MEQTAYMDALKEFSTLLQHYPKGKRAPGALLRTAISYDAMGQKELAAGVARQEGGGVHGVHATSRRRGRYQR